MRSRTINSYNHLTTFHIIVVHYILQNEIIETIARTVIPAHVGNKKIKSSRKHVHERVSSKVNTVIIHTTGKVVGCQTPLE